MAGGVYAGGGATVVMDPPPLVYGRVFGPGSPPERFNKKQAQEVALRASRIAPVKTGRLASSIRFSQNRQERGRFGFGFSVYTTVFYANYVHEGTGPSVRHGHGKKMKFRGTNGSSGQLVFPTVVHHPGTPSQPFLRNALVAMVR